MTGAAVRGRRRPRGDAAGGRRDLRRRVVPARIDRRSRTARAMIRILVVDDHALVRRGLIQLMQGLPDGVQFGEAGTAAEALTLAYGDRWDVEAVTVGKAEVEQHDV